MIETHFDEKLNLWIYTYGILEFAGRTQEAAAKLLAKHLVKLNKNPATTIQRGKSL